MKIQNLEPPREFQAGSVRIRHCANIELAPDEQVTFVTPEGREYDVVRKDWGFYATPSLNARLRKQGFRSALVCNPEGKIFLRLVEKDRADAFRAYVEDQGERILCWLDSDGDVLSLLRALGIRPPPGFPAKNQQEDIG